MKMWLTLGTAALAVSAAAAAHIDAPVQREHRQSHVLRPTGSEPVVDLRSFGGRVEVIADEGGDVRLDVVTNIAARTDADADSAEREIRLDTAENGALVSAIVYDERGRYCGDERPNHERGSREWRYEVSHRITARVPRGARVQVCTVNTRDVDVRGPVGNFDITNVNGRINIEGALGNGRAVTVNGPVTVTLAGALAERSVFKTINGDVTVTVPEPLSAELRMKTFNGELLTDFDVEPVPARAVATTESRNGRFVFRSNQFTTVRAGTGGPEITLETINGDVRVLRAAR